MPDVLKPCPKCRTPMETFRRQCVFCDQQDQQGGKPGTFLQTWPDPPQSPQGTTAASPVPADAKTAFQCAHCGSEQVQRVSGLVRQGVWTAESAGTYVGGSYIGGLGVHAGVVSNQTAGASVIAQLLTPPVKPREPSPPAAFGWTFIVVGILATLSGLSGALPNLISGFSALVLGALLIGWEKQGEARQRTSFNSALSRWQAALAVWERLNYCPRCDHVSDPETRTAAPSNAIHTLYPQ